MTFTTPDDRETTAEKIQLLEELVRASVIGVVFFHNLIHHLLYEEGIRLCLLPYSYFSSVNKL
jgi:hypothetical protein